MNTEKLYQLNSFLQRLASDVDWEVFRSILSVLRKERPKGGRLPFDVVLMFKIIVLKSQYNLSDEMTEFFIRDRRTFQDFLGITTYHTIPNAKTIWLFAEQMKNAHLEEVVFDKFLEMLESKGIKPQGGTLVDGTFVEVPHQHNTKAENEQLKKGKFRRNSSRIRIWTVRRRIPIRLTVVREFAAEILKRGYEPQRCEKGLQESSADGRAEKE